MNGPCNAITNQPPCDNVRPANSVLNAVNTTDRCKIKATTTTTTTTHKQNKILSSTLKYLKHMFKSKQQKFDTEPKRTNKIKACCWNLR